MSERAKLVLKYFEEQKDYLNARVASGMQSRVLRANRLMDLTMIISTFPHLHWRISLLNSSRFFMLVPVIPLSA